MISTWARSIFIVVLTLFATVPVGLIIQFYRRRDMSPLNHRLPNHFIAVATSLTGYALEQCVINLWGGSLYMVPSIVVECTFISLAVDALTIIAYTVYTTFMRTRHQIKLVNELFKNGEKNELARLNKIIQRTNVLLHQRTAAIMVALSVSLLAVAQVLYVVITHPEYLSIRNDAEDSVALETFITSLRNIAVYKFVCNTAIVTFLAFRLRIVCDVYGTKRILRTVALVNIVALLIYFIVQPRLNELGKNNAVSSMVYIFLCAVNITIIMLIPLQDSYIVEKNKLPTSRIPLHCQCALFDFISTPIGFEAFKRHLEAECSVECITFWQDVQAYRRTFREGSPETEKAARSIFDTFISPDAPLQINIEFAVSKALRLLFAMDKPELGLDTFLDAEEHIGDLMQSEMFTRFRDKRDKHWERFQAVNEEAAIFLIMDSTVRGNTTSADNRISTASLAT